VAGDEPRPQALVDGTVTLDRFGQAGEGQARMGQRVSSSLS